MIRPLENQERINTGEYVNRVRKSEGTHSSSPRDFGYEIEAAEHDEKRRRQAAPEFGEDTYEAAPDDEPAPDKDSSAPADPDDQGKLDITV